MINLGEIGIDIANDNNFAKTRRNKLVLIRHRLGLSEGDAEVAFKVFRKAARNLEKIRKVVDGL